MLSFLLTYELSNFILENGIYEKSWYLLIFSAIFLVVSYILFAVKKVTSKFYPAPYNDVEKAFKNSLEFKYYGTSGEKPVNDFEKIFDDSNIDADIRESNIEISILEENNKSKRFNSAPVYIIGNNLNKPEIDYNSYVINTSKLLSTLTLNIFSKEDSMYIQNLTESNSSKIYANFNYLKHGDILRIPNDSCIAIDEYSIKIQYKLEG